MFKKIKEKLLYWFRINAIEFFDREMILLEKIKISNNFKKHYPRKDKMQERWAYYNKYKELKVPIIINKDNRLIDGYTSYLIAKKLGIKRISVKRVWNN